MSVWILQCNSVFAVCVHFCMYQTILLDFYLVHLFNWYKTQISSWDEQNVQGMQTLLRRDDVIKNIGSLPPERICMSVHGITQNQVPHGVPDSARENFSQVLLFTSSILLWVAVLWEFWVLTAVLKHEKSAKTEGFPCEAVTSYSFAVTCYVMVNAEAHTRPIPEWFLPLLTGRNALCD